MAHDFKDTINVPIAIPAWGAACLIAGALFTAGTLYQKMDALIEDSRASDARTTLMHERQIIANAAIVALERQGAASESRMSNFDARLSNLERGQFQEKRQR